MERKVSKGPGQSGGREGERTDTTTLKKVLEVCRVGNIPLLIEVRGDNKLYFSAPKRFCIESDITSFNAPLHSTRLDSIVFLDAYEGTERLGRTDALPGSQFKTHLPIVLPKYKKPENNLLTPANARDFLERHRPEK